LLVAKVQVLDTEAESFGKPKAGTVEKPGHEAIWALHFVEDRLNLVRRQHHRKPLRFFRSVKVRPPVPVAPEDVAVQKQNGIEGLILCRSRDVSLGGEIGEVRPDIGFLQVTGMCGVVVFYVPDDPAGAGLLGAVAVAFSLAGGPDAVEERGGGAHDGNK
jgi:hypothetical protein